MNLKILIETKILKMISNQPPAAKKLIILCKYKDIVYSAHI